MAKQSAGFVDLHIEKVVIGVCGSALLGIFGYYFVFGSPDQVEGLKPDALFQELQTTAEDTAKAVNNAAYKPKAGAGEGGPVDDALRRLGQWFGSKAEGLIKLAGIQPEWARLQRFPPELVPVSEKTKEDRHNLAQLVST